MTAAIDLAPQPRTLEFVCDRCLYSVNGSDQQPIPRCPRCRIRMTPDDLSIPRDRFSLARTARRKAAEC